MTDRPSKRYADEVREQTREQVRAALARAPEVPERTCPHCGEVRRTSYEHCPACGESYFTKRRRFSRRTRRALVAGTVALIAAVLGIGGVLVGHQGHRNQARDKQRAARAIAAERRRRAVEQRPRHLRVDLRDPGRRAAAAVRLRQRGAMVQRLEDAITADARSRVRARLLPVRRISTTHCHALANGAPGDERDLAKPLGRYACEAVVAAARNKALLSTLGVPFVGTIDFTRGRLTWCKDNPVGAGDVESAYAFVRLSRECTAARGPAFGSGYLLEPPKSGSH